MYNIKESIDENKEITKDDFKYLEYNDINLNFIKQHNIYYYNDCLDCLNISIECMNNYNFNGSCYILFAKYNNKNENKSKIIMTMFVFLNKKNKFQFNMLITKHPSQIINLDKNIHKNIALFMHSYAASLFNSNIIATRPLPFMLKILQNNIYNLKKINTDDEYDKIFNMTKSKLDKFMGIAHDEITYYFEIDNNFKNLHKNSILEFSNFKVS